MENVQCIKDNRVDPQLSSTYFTQGFDLKKKREKKNNTLVHVVFTFVVTFGKQFGILSVASCIIATRDFLANIKVTSVTAKGYHDACLIRLMEQLSARPIFCVFPLEGCRVSTTRMFAASCVTGSCFLRDQHVNINVNVRITV